jgi:hypothetical protein
MIYLVGGPPRVGKSILTQQTASTLAISWISTDVLKTFLGAHIPSVPGIHWNQPATITATAEWFFPALERFIWAASSMIEHYLIEGVDFLPTQVAELAKTYPIRCVFLGCSVMTLERFEQFPGLSPGYIGLPADLRQQIIQHVPLHSMMVQREAEQFGYPYIDMVGDFQARLREAATVLTVHGHESHKRGRFYRSRAALAAAGAQPVPPLNIASSTDTYGREHHVGNMSVPS